MDFVGEVMSLLFNMLSRFVITFLPRLQVSFNFMAAVTVCSDFGPQENKICHCFYFFPSICHEVMGPDAMILVLVQSVNLPYGEMRNTQIQRANSYIPFYIKYIEHTLIWMCMRVPRSIP